MNNYHHRKGYFYFGFRSNFTALTPSSKIVRSRTYPFTTNSNNRSLFAGKNPGQSKIMCSSLEAVRLEKWNSLVILWWGDIISSQLLLNSENETENIQFWSLSLAPRETVQLTVNQTLRYQFSERIECLDGWNNVIPSWQYSQYRYCKLFSAPFTTNSFQRVWRVGKIKTAREEFISIIKFLIIIKEMWNIKMQSQRLVAYRKIHKLRVSVTEN